VTGRRLGSTRRGVAVLAVALAVGCSRRTGKTVAIPKQPDRVPQLVAGPPIRPAGPLLEWLSEVGDAPGPRRLLRLPVVARFEDEFRLALSDAVVGMEAAALDDEAAIRLKLDDTGLGVALPSSLRKLSPERTSVVWLEGHWGPLVQLPMLGLPGGDDGRHTFAVLRVHGPVETPPTGEEARVLVAPPTP